MSDYDEKEDGPSSIDLTHMDTPNRTDEMDFFSFESVIARCSSITQTAINCPSLQQNFASLPCSTSGDINDNNNNNESYQEEVELSKWLDCQISNLETALHSIQDTSSLHHHRSEEDEYKKSDHRKKEHEIKKLRQELLLETVQEQQERLYLSRLRMSLAASFTKLSPIRKESNSNIDNYDEEIDKHQQLLLREALKSRDRAVLSALEKSKKADQYQIELNELTKRYNSLKRKNQIIWNQLLSNEQQTKSAPKQGPLLSSNHNDTSHPLKQLSSDEDYLRKETILIKHVMVDIIINSGLDWHSDPTLNDIMMELED